MRGRFYRETWAAGENYEKIQFEDEQIRVTRLVCAPGKKLDIPVGTTSPSLLVALSTARLNMSAQKGKVARVSLELGQTGWQPAGQQAQLENPGGEPAELLRFEFKPEPVKDVDGKSKQHNHLHN